MSGNKTNDAIRRKIMGILRSVRGFYLDNGELVHAMQDYEGEVLSHGSVLGTFVREEEAELQAATDALVEIVREERQRLEQRAPSEN